MAVADCIQSLGDFVALIPEPAETTFNNPGSQYLSAQIGEKENFIGSISSLGSYANEAVHLKTKVQVVLDAFRGAATIQAWLRNAVSLSGSGPGWRFDDLTT